MIKFRIKNYSLRPKFDVDEILDFVGCKMSSRKLLKAVWSRNGHAASLGVKFYFFVSSYIHVISVQNVIVKRASKIFEYSFLKNGLLEIISKAVIVLIVC